MPYPERRSSDRTAAMRSPEGAIGHYALVGTASARRSSNAAMRLFLLGIIVLVVVGCSASDHASSAATSTTVASTTTTFDMCRGCNLPRPEGTITGRYYADGGPPPLGYLPPRGLSGKITVTNVQSLTTFHPREDARGYFTVVVPIGIYDVVGSPDDAVGPMTARARVTVTTGKPVHADLGIHMA